MCRVQLARCLHITTPRFGGWLAVAATLALATTFSQRKKLEELRDSRCLHIDASDLGKGKGHTSHRNQSKRGLAPPSLSSCSSDFSNFPTSPCRWVRPRFPRQTQKYPCPSSTQAFSLSHMTYVASMAPRQAPFLLSGSLGFLWPCRQNQQRSLNTTCIHLGNVIVTSESSC